MVVAVVAWRARALTWSGAAMATLIGGSCLLAGPEFAVLLVLFFVTSSALSRLRPASAIAAKSGGRDGLQVLANGGVAAAVALVYARERASLWPAVFVAALLAATADTWATEIGGHSKRTPRLITNGTSVPPGTSGGVTLAGLAASAAGGLLVGVAAILLGLVTVPMGVVAALAGFTGSLVDSLLGATIQEVRLCPRCSTSTEQRVHAACGSATFRIRGLPYLDNDVVNLLATACAAVLCAILVRI